MKFLTLLTLLISTQAMADYTSYCRKRILSNTAFYLSSWAQAAHLAAVKEARADGHVSGIEYRGYLGLYKIRQQADPFKDVVRNDYRNFDKVYSQFQKLEQSYVEAGSGLALAGFSQDVLEKYDKIRIHIWWGNKCFRD